MIAISKPEFSYKVLATLDLALVQHAAHLTTLGQIWVTVAEIDAFSSSWIFASVYSVSRCCTSLYKRVVVRPTTDVILQVPSPCLAPEKQIEYGDHSRVRTIQDSPGRCCE